jgi:transglutaminase-like putative cysteine protease
MNRPLLFFGMQLLLLDVFLFEELTWPTMAVALAAWAVRWKGLSLPRWLPQLVGGAVFVFGFLTFGRAISPEMGLNILMGVVALKLAEAREERDWRMLTLGFFLVWASGGLFVRTPAYLLASLASILGGVLVLSRLLGKHQGITPRELARWLLRAVPLGLLLFFFLPRFHANVWSPPAPNRQGEIGFSEEARPSEVEKLVPTGRPAFSATLSVPLQNRDLYWRGATLSGHDGWNWFAHPLDAEWSGLGDAGRVAPGRANRQLLIHHRPVQRPLALEWGLWLEFDGRQAMAGPQGTWRLPPTAQLRRYTVWSDPRLEFAPPAATELRAWQIAPSLRKDPRFKDWPVDDLAAATARLAQFFGNGGYTYTLQPGQRMGDLASFLAAKRGWCVHYASATGLILRGLGYPTRLVSGYLGGEYNPRGGQWSVSEDDAHVWVEAWDGRAWRRLDPTLWVAPARGLYSGAEFFRRQAGLNSPWAWAPAWVREGQQWWQDVNFRFLVWSETLDRELQRSWARRFRFNLAQWYLTGLWGLAAGVVAWWLWERWRGRPRREPRHARSRAWAQWRRWAERRGMHVPSHWGPVECRAHLDVLGPVQSEAARSWLEAWEKLVYAHQDCEAELKTLVRKLP